MTKTSNPMPWLKWWMPVVGMCTSLFVLWPISIWLGVNSKVWDEEAGNPYREGFDAHLQMIADYSGGFSHVLGFAALLVGMFSFIGTLAVVVSWFVQISEKYTK